MKCKWTQCTLKGELVNVIESPHGDPVDPDDIAPRLLSVESWAVCVPSCFVCGGEIVVDGLDREEEANKLGYTNK